MKIIYELDANKSVAVRQKKNKILLAYLELQVQIMSNCEREMFE